VNTKAVAYREANHSDAEGIASLHTDSWRRTYRGIYRDEFLDGEVAQNRRLEWTRRLSNPPQSQYTLLAEVAGSVVGFACVFGDDDPQWGSMLDNLHVRFDQQGSGLGSELIKRSALWVREHCASPGIFLWVFEANQSARRFYERLGATNSESGAAEVPGGGMANHCRYSWSRTDTLIARASNKHLRY
jgi:GNAT superfamily N-acetyltransferase